MNRMTFLIIAPYKYFYLLTYLLMCLKTGCVTVFVELYQSMTTVVYLIIIINK